MKMNALSSLINEMAPSPHPSDHTTSINTSSISPSINISSTNTTTSTTTSTTLHTTSPVSKAVTRSNNRFASLLEEESSTVLQSTSTSSIPSATSMFQQPTFSGSAATYATSLVRINKPQLLTTALGDLSELTGALDSALHSQDMSETERIGNAQRSWDLSNLHSVTTNLVPEKHRHNEFLGRTSAEHEKDLATLNEGLKQSKRHMSREQGQRKKKGQATRGSNKRKKKNKQKGTAYAERNAHSAKAGKGGGRRKKNRGSGRRQTPY